MSPVGHRLGVLPRRKWAFRSRCGHGFHTNTFLHDRYPRSLPSLRRYPIARNSHLGGYPTSHRVIYWTQKPNMQLSQKTPKPLPTLPTLKLSSSLFWWQSWSLKQLVFAVKSRSLNWAFTAPRLQAQVRCIGQQKWQQRLPYTAAYRWSISSHHYGQQRWYSSAKLKFLHRV